MPKAALGSFERCQRLVVLGRQDERVSDHQAGVEEHDDGRDCATGCGYAHEHGGHGDTDVEVLFRDFGEGEYASACHGEQEAAKANRECHDDVAPSFANGSSHGFPRFKHAHSDITSKHTVLWAGNDTCQCILPCLCKVRRSRFVEFFLLCTRGKRSQQRLALNQGTVNPFS